ncbi:hypothetical protein [Salibacterium qingdaonense]|uniref:hypothetical protein n=1 Tax=Salibacterium qingdaonense TaxID=266892 RepID=UPI001160D465|nr:hypothetical protein [Salibacterium qingdaonense]
MPDRRPGHTDADIRSINQEIRRIDREMQRINREKSGNGKKRSRNGSIDQETRRIDRERRSMEAVPCRIGGPATLMLTSRESIKKSGELIEKCRGSIEKRGEMGKSDRETEALIKKPAESIENGAAWRPPRCRIGGPATLMLISGASIKKCGELIEKCRESIEKRAEMGKSDRETEALIKKPAESIENGAASKLSPRRIGGPATLMLISGASIKKSGETIEKCRASIEKRAEMGNIDRETEASIKKSAESIKNCPACTNR